MRAVRDTGMDMADVSQDKSKRSWLAGRLLSANWDCDQLGARKDEIVAKDLLKLKLTLH